MRGDARIAAVEKRPGPASVEGMPQWLPRGALRGKGLAAPDGLKRDMWAVSVAAIRRSFSRPVLCITAIVDPAPDVCGSGERQCSTRCHKGEPS